MRFLRFLVVWCLIFTMLSGYVVVMTPTANAVTPTIYHTQDFEGFTTNPHDDWYVPNGGTPFISTVRSYSGSSSVDMNGDASSIAYLGFGTAMFPTHQLHLSAMIYVEQYPIINSTLAIMANPYPEWYYNILVTPSGHIVTDNQVAGWPAKNNDTGKVLPLSSWCKLDIVLINNDIYFGINGNFTGAMYNQQTDFWRSYPFNPQFTSQSTFHYYLDDVVWDDDVNIPAKIIVPIMPSVNSFEMVLVNTAITGFLLLLPAILIGAFTGRYGFMITLSLMAAVYLIIDPTIIPVSLIIWVQSAVMFYRGG